MDRRSSSSKRSGDKPCGVLSSEPTVLIGLDSTLLDPREKDTITWDSCVSYSATDLGLNHLPFDVFDASPDMSVKKSLMKKRASYNGKYFNEFG